MIRLSKPLLAMMFLLPTMAADAYNNTVAVCDPVNPFNCLAPNSSGNVPITPVPNGVTTTSTTAAPTAGTFFSILAASASRKSCTIQNTGTTLGYVYFGANASATTGNSFQLPPSTATSTFTASCATQNGLVLQDNVSATCASGTCSFVIGAQ